MVTNPRFQSADYAVFVCLLVASSLVGIVQAIVVAIRKKLRKGDEPPKQETVANARNLSVWPAALGVIGSNSAAPFVVGVPAEMYFFGTEFSLYVIGVAIAVPLLTHLLYARLYRMHLTDIYEYFELRFHKVIRSMCSVLFILLSLIYMGVITYAPATAFGQVTGVPVEGSIAIVGLIAIVYTAIGTLKETLWVDMIQMLVLLASVLATIIKGTNDAGGISKVWMTAYNGGRIQFNVVDPNPLVRTSLWTQAIGGTFSMLVIFTQPSLCQKILRQQSLKNLYITSYFALLAKCFYTWMFCLCGVVIYAYYAACSPVALGLVQDSNSLLPYFVVDIFHSVPGVSGLFMAALFCACLSVIAAGLNALTTITVMNAIRPAYLKKTGKEMKSIVVTVIYKCFVVFYGLIATALGYAAPKLGSNVLTTVLNLASTVCGPMMGLFIMGVCMPWVNSWGAGFGLVVSLGFMFWLSIGALFAESKYMLTKRSIMKLPVAGCPRPAAPAVLAGNVTAGLFTTTPAMFSAAGNFTDGITQSFAATTGYMLQNSATNVTAAIKAAVTPAPYPSNFEMFYYTSYMWYSLIAILICIVVGVVVSAISQIIANLLGSNMAAPVVDPALSFMCCYKKSTVYKVEESLDAKETEPPAERYRTLPEEHSQVKLNDYDNKAFQNGKLDSGISSMGISSIAETPYVGDKDDMAPPYGEDYIGHPQVGQLQYENYGYE